MNFLPKLLCCFLFTAAYVIANAQTVAKTTIVAGVPVNYDEAKVGDYVLPDPLLLQNGKPVKTAKVWMKQRRPEVLQLFERHQFGKMPSRPKEIIFDVFETGSQAFGGKALRKQVTLYLTGDTSTHKVNVLIYLPAGTKKPPPLLLTLSFVTNAMAVDDPEVKPGIAWINGTRVIQTSSTFKKVDVEKFINAGIGYATVYYGDIEPDFKEGIKHGIRSHYLKKGQEQLAADEWGAISAWSWGLSRIMDYFEKDTDIDSKRIALNGASRLGKTVLWTGARDQRFALIIPSISGEGGASLSRRNYGETIKMITDKNRYYYQFAPNYHGFSDSISNLPMDSHMLIALVAPRPLLLQTGNQDFFSDPKGEFAAATAAAPVYQLFGKSTINRKEMPAAGDISMLTTLGYYMHDGGHTVLPEDYDIFIRFIQKHLMSGKTMQ